MFKPCMQIISQYVYITKTAMYTQVHIGLSIRFPVWGYNEILLRTARIILLLFWHTHDILKYVCDQIY